MIIKEPSKLQVFSNQLASGVARLLHESPPLEQVITRQRISADSAAGFSTEVERMRTEGSDDGSVNIPLGVVIVGAKHAV